MSLPKRNRTAISIALLLALLAAGLYFVLLRGEPSERVEQGAIGGAQQGTDQVAEPGAEPAPVSAPPPETSDLLPLTVLRDAPFAQEFGAEGTSPARELELVQLAFADYLSFVKERYQKPFGYHEELLALLVGGNPLRVAPVPPDHPRIDPQGRLTDHWGTAFDIHPLSSTAIEIRSAGPDREMHTADDLHNVTPSGQEILDAMRPVAETGAEADSGAAQGNPGGGGR